MWRGEHGIDPRLALLILFLVMYVVPYVVRFVPGYDASN